MKLKYILLLFINSVFSYNLIYKPLDSQQLKFEKLLKNNDISLVTVIGTAGTGKTLLSCQEAIHQLKLKKKEKIIITRPLKNVDNEEFGFLPGDLKEKMYPWTLPIFDYMKEFISHDEIKKLIDENIIEICPLAFMRGRTFKKSFIILDEAQNTTPKQMKMFLTRIGLDSKIIINGDIEQSDIINEINGLEDFINKLELYYENDIYKMNKEGFGLIKLNKNNIYRNEIIKKIINIYEK